MLLLHHGTGSQEFYAEGLEYPEERWQVVRAAALRQLRDEDNALGLEYLSTLPFRLYRASNGFGDEFSVLQCSLPFERYVELRRTTAAPDAKSAFSDIASAFSDFTYVRFIAVDLDQSDTAAPVPDPVVEGASETVRRALADASHLVAARGAVSAVDRVHTAFHGYLREVCAQAALPVPADASVTSVFKLLRDAHPNFAFDGPRAQDIEKIGRSLAAVIDALNPIRNRASLAHPNDSLLEEAEAMLALNSIRTVFNYVLARVNGGAR
jgi:hypothetical protein